MSLTIQVSNLTVRVATQFKTVTGWIGNLTSLATTNKSSLVAAINEIHAGIGAGGTVTVDAITDATTIGKGVLKASNAGAVRTLIGAGTSDLVIGSLSTNAKAGNYVPAWGEITSKPTVIAAGADAAAARTAISVSSTADMNAAITSAIDALVAGAPGALDTLKEIADKIAAGDADLAAVVSGLANRLRVDAAQSFTEPQKVQGRANLDVYSKTEIGNTEIDLVSVFEAALT